MKIYTVSQLTAEISKLLINNFPGIWVEGEITNYRPAGSGHIYFDLKDESALLQCVIWKDNKPAISVDLKNGLKLKTYGYLRVYARGGKYNLQVERVYPAGIGELQIRFEELKLKLKEEGLFDAEHKKPIPRFITRIGVVTALDSAAFHDIVKIARNRYPGIEIIVRNSRVQGEGAGQDIANGIEEFNEYTPISDRVELIIIARGGGSLEDLWAFNEEIVARAIYNSVIPIVSAVGHEIDFTIADFVADFRASTPSASAELTVIDSKVELYQLNEVDKKFKNLLKEKIARLKEKLTAIEKSYGINRLADLIHSNFQTLDEIETRLKLNWTHFLKNCTQHLAILDGKLSVVNPHATLKEGTVYATNYQPGKL